MLQIFTSNSLRELAQTIAADFIRAPLPPEHAETIIVQSESLAFWLKLRLAEYLGCAAGLQMLFPNTLCQKLTAREDNPVPSQDYLNWQIFHILGKDEFTDNHPILARYLQDNDPVKRLQFACRLGTIFNNYLIYRPQMLLEWESGSNGNNETSAWQSQLWQQLPEAPRATEFRQMLQSITPDMLPARLSAFAPSTLPPLFLEFLQRASTFIPVHIYAMSPTPHFWTDILSKRELLRSGEETDSFDSTPASRFLASLGRQGREFFYNLTEIDPSGQSRQELDYPEPQPKTLLGALQQRIYCLGLEEPAYQPQPGEPDDSLLINSCHSPMREVEVLHEWVLDILAKDPEIQPSDILVLISDIETYSPWIKAVFGSCDILGRSFRISDRIPAAQEEFEQALLALLKIPASRFEASRVLELLDYQPLREASGLSHEEVQTITAAIVELNIRWGIDGKAQHKSSGSDLKGINSWRNGLNRLLMGFATGNLDEICCGVLPYSSELSRQTGAKFCHWFEKLVRLSTKAARALPLKEWQQQLNTLCHDMLSGSYRDRLNEDDPAQQLLGDFPDTENRIDLQTLTCFLERKFSGGGSPAFLGGGINFCSLKPLRSVPFEVIAVLGLGYEQFPRREKREQFNLLRDSHIPGDPSSRDDDRQLFIETLLSARSKLILSYCGQSQKDLGESPPSVCLSELLDFIEEEFSADLANSLTVHHPLQPFSEKYYNHSDPRLFSYTPQILPVDEQLNAADKMSLPSGTLTEQSGTEQLPQVIIELNELIRFYKNPARYYCQHILGLRVPYEEPSPEDVEALGEDRNEKRRLERELLLRPQTSQDELCGRFLQEGIMPASAAGSLLLESELSALQPLRDIAAALPEPHQLSQSIKLTGNITLAATIDQLYADGRTIVLPASPHAYLEIELWLKHLTLCCADTATPHVTTIHTAQESLELQAVDQAQEILSAICTHFLKGQQKALEFFPRTSRAYAEQEYKLAKPGSRSRKPAMDIARETWKGNIRSKGEHEDLFIQMCFKDSAPLDAAEFPIIATEFWHPFFCALQEVSQ